MSTRWIALWAAVLSASALWGGEDAKPSRSDRATPKSPLSDPLADKISGIKKAQLDRRQKFYDELRAAKDQKTISQLNEDYNKFSVEQAEKLLTLIRNNAEAPATFEAILVLVNPVNYYLPDHIIHILFKHHLANPKMGELCFAIRYQWHATWPEKVLKETVAKHPEHAVRGQALYALGENYRERAQPPQEKRSEKEQAKYFAEAARCFREVTEKYADARTPDGREKLGDKAAAELIRIRNIPNLKVGKRAPEIEGEDIDGKQFKLGDYRGKVVLLDFWGHW